MKQNSSSKLKNIYSNNGIGGTQNDKNALYQQKMLLKNQNQIRNSYNSGSLQNDVSIMENGRKS